MRFQIKHESHGRMRIRLFQKRMTLAQADVLEAWAVYAAADSEGSGA